MNQPVEQQRWPKLEVSRKEAKKKTRAKKIFIYYFGAKEKESADALASVRDRLFERFANWAIRLNISPKHVTLLSFLIQLIFFPLFFAFESYNYAFLVLLVHILLDSFDGPVARIRKVESNSGALADILNDTTGLVIVGLSIIFFGDISYTGWMAAYLVLHLYHTAFNIVLNFYQHPFAYVFPTKFLFFILVLLKYLLNFDILPIFFMVSITYMAISCIFGMLRIFDALDTSDALIKTSISDEEDA